MEISQELIEKHGLSEEAVSDINNIATSYKDELEQSLSERVNKHSEGVLNGYVESIQKEYGITVPREQGEKVKDWAARALPATFEKKQKEIESLKAEYDEKLKTAGKEDVKEIKAQYEIKSAELLKRFEGFDTFKEKAEKADKYELELNTLREDIALEKVKPKFPDSVNEWEANGKWSNFLKETKEKYNIGLDDKGEPVYIDKEFPDIKKPLKDLVAKNEEIQALVKGRQQQGVGAHSKGESTIEGVPFKVNLNHSRGEIDKQIREYLKTSEGLQTTNRTYSTRFSEIREAVQNARRQGTV